MLRMEMKFGDTFFFARKVAVAFAQPESREAIGRLLGDSFAMMAIKIGSILDNDCRQAREGLAFHNRAFT